MHRRLIERRLRALSGRLSRARRDLAVLEEQLVQFSDEADDLEVRALVSEAPLAEQEFSAARRHSTAHQRERAELQALISRLERDQDALLDRLSGSN